MGQYYRFINRNRQAQSEVGLPFNFGMPWGKSMERLSPEELKKQFDLGEWLGTDRRYRCGRGLWRNDRLS
jgi:hypothetical protein